MTNAASTFAKTLKPRAVEEFIDFYFYRRIAAWFVPIFYKLKMSPNQVTWLSLISGIAGALLIFKNQMLWGVLLCVLCIVFDCADGQLARLTGQSSAMGRALDGLVDTVCIALWWTLFYFSGQLGPDENRVIMAAFIFAGASTLVHCWRYDAVKIKSLELVETDYKESDLDFKTAMALVKSEFKAWRVFNAVLALAYAVQIYLFGRGGKPKAPVTLSETERVRLKPVFDAHIRYWAWLGPGHHNTLLLMGIALSPWTLWGVWIAFFIMAVPMNVMHIVGEIRFWRDYKKAKAAHSLA